MSGLKSNSFRFAPASSRNILHNAVESFLVSYGTHNAKRNGKGISTFYLNID